MDRNGRCRCHSRAAVSQWSALRCRGVCDAFDEFGVLIDSIRVDDRRMRRLAGLICDPMNRTSWIERSYCNDKHSVVFPIRSRCRDSRWPKVCFFVDFLGSIFYRVHIEMLFVLLLFLASGRCRFLCFLTKYCIKSHQTRPSPSVDILVNFFVTDALPIIQCLVRTVFQFSRDPSIGRPASIPHFGFIPVPARNISCLFEFFRRGFVRRCKAFPWAVDEQYVPSVFLFRSSPDDHRVVAVQYLAISLAGTFPLT